jgi:predicted nucleic acid-binding OB-fold protein
METLRILENQNERRHMLAKFREIKTKLKQDIDPPEIIFKKIYRDLFPPKNPVYRKN